MADPSQQPRRAWFRFAGGLGLLLDGQFHDVSGLLGADPIACLGRGQLTGHHLDELAVRVGEPMASAPALLTPVPNPSKILCLGKNFHAHAAEFGSEAPKEPMFFNKLTECLLDPEGEVELPPEVGRVDHEAEICLVIGKRAKNIAATEAAAIVAGVTLIDDVTARDVQGAAKKKGFPWVRSKSFDTFGPVGPWVVPFEDLFDGEIPEDATPDLELEAKVNGETRQLSRTSLMVQRVAPTLAYLSRQTTLRPGDLIPMGTPEGVGPIAAGDRIEIRAERIGSLFHGVRA